MSLAMNDLQFSAFILHLKTNQPEMPIRKAACVIGQQPCDCVWVLGKDLQVCVAVLWVSAYIYSIHCIPRFKKRI